MLTLEKFEEASEVVKEVTLDTELIYSNYFSEQTGNKVYLKPENMQFTGAYYGLCREPRPGCSLCGEMLWGEGDDCDAHHHAAD